MVVTLFHSQLTSFLRRCAREELKTSTEALLTYRHSESGKVRKERSSSRLGVALLLLWSAAAQSNAGAILF